MRWQVFLSRDATKQAAKLPSHIEEVARALMQDMEANGPVRFNWQNFTKLRGYDHHYHCHIKKGRPTYVACWEIINKRTHIIEVYYVGTHEKAPYQHR